MTDPDNVVDLPGATGIPEPPPSPPGRIHGIAIAGMGVSAIVGVLTMVAFITVTWPASIARVVIAI